MNSEQRRRIDDLCAEALDMPRDQRTEFVNQAESDPFVRDEVLRKLEDASQMKTDWLSRVDTEILRGKGEFQGGEKGARTQSFRIGTVLAGRYSIERLINLGGMGEVYAVWDQKLNQRTALKTILPEIARHRSAMDRFRREVALARVVTHPNVCRVFDFGEHTEAGAAVPFLTMEYLSGETLGERLKRDGSMSPQQALPLVRQMTAALEAVHQAGIVHRDFKPGNVMLLPELDGSERVVITDFGIALAAKREEGESKLTLSGMVVGTPGYMAPEQWMGATLTPATDLYALGAVIYEMLTGGIPASSKLIDQVQDDRWAAVIDRCLEKDPEARLQSATEVIRVLNGTVSLDMGDKRLQTLAVSVLGDSERRQITFLYCEIADVTDQDPEEFAASLVEFRRLARQTAEHFDGYLTPYSDDAVVLYFGYPNAQEDAARRAVSAGLEILRASAASSLTVRVGVATSLALAKLQTGKAEPVLGQGAVAARKLAQLAEERVLISGDTAKLVQDYFEVRQRPATDIFEVQKQAVVRSRLGHAKNVRFTRFIGRGYELQALLDRWRRVEEGNGHVIVVTGGPGIGKSRLVHEVSRRIAQNSSAYLVECFCSPYSAGSAYFPVVDLIERNILAPGHSVASESRLERLETLLGETGLLLDQYVPVLAPLFSISLGEAYSSAPALTPDRQRALVLNGLLSLLIYRSATQPVLLVVEDLHWADPSTLELLGMLLDRISPIPILALFTCRPDFIPQWSGPSYMPISLERLAGGDVAEMTRAAADDKELPIGVLDQIARNSDGIPLFIEELTKHVLESGTSGTSKASVPATLRDSLLSRLDRLGEAKRLAQMASVIGREFSLSVLASVCGLPEIKLEPVLKRLMDAELLYLSGRQDRKSYMFRHALLQDAAYESLVKRSRVVLHQQVATALQQLSPEIAERQPEILAHHFTEAGLPVEAIPFWRLAGSRALERSAYHEAVALFRRALEVNRSLPEKRKQEEQEGVLLTNLGLPLIALNGFGSREVGEVYEQAHEHMKTAVADPCLLPSLFGLWVYNLVRAELATAEELASRMVQSGENTGDVEMAVEGHWALGDTLYWQGRLLEARTHLQQSLALYDRKRFRAHAFQLGQDPAVAAGCYLAFTLYVTGDAAAALDAVEHSINLARELNHPFSIGWTLAFRSMLAYWSGDAESTLNWADEGIRYCSEQAYPFWITCCMVVKGWALCRQGQYNEGVPSMREGLAGMQMIGSEVIRPLYMGITAEALQLAGSLDEAVALTTTAIAEAQRQGNRISEIDLHRIHGDLLAALGNYSEAEHSLGMSRKLAKECGAEFFADARQRGFSK